MKENTYIYREIMDKLNESSMLMTNYLMSTLRSDGNAMNSAEVEKCYNGLLEEYSKVFILLQQSYIPILHHFHSCIE